MKCNDCRWLHLMLPCIESPYGEAACMKLETDLYSAKPEDVEKCEHYEKSISLINIL